MNDIQSLPLIEPPLTNPPASGTRFRDRFDFVYEMIEAKPHKNRDGTASYVLTIRGQCADCGGLFLFKQGPMRTSLPRRCPEDAKGKGRERTYPFGSAAAAGKAATVRVPMDIENQAIRKIAAEFYAYADKHEAELRKLHPGDIFADFVAAVHPEALPPEDSSGDIFS